MIVAALVGGVGLMMENAGGNTPAEVRKAGENCRMWLQRKCMESLASGRWFRLYLPNASLSETLLLIWQDGTAETWSSGGACFFQLRGHGSDRSYYLPRYGMFVPGFTLKMRCRRDPCVVPDWYLIVSPYGSITVREDPPL